MKISVCMATRNGERYIEEQLNSILKQLGPDDEVVISDDSSTDRTVQIVRGLGDGRIRLSEGNTFYSPIFNFENALRRATGELVVLSDQDDVWLDNKIALIREHFRRNLSPVHAVVLDGCIVNEAGKVIGESIFARIKSRPGLLKNIYDNTYLGCCMAFTRPLLEVALPFPKVIPMHDMWLGLLAELFGTVAFVEEKTIRYRKHAASMTDFRREFKPVTQIKRRILLTYSLAARYVALGFGRHPSSSTLPGKDHA